MEATWRISIPIDRSGNALSFELKEIGIDAFMAIQTFIEKKKIKEAIIIFLNETRVGGDEVKMLQNEFDNNNIIPFSSAFRAMTEILEPLSAEIKKN